jgi:hypothetical protein
MTENTDSKALLRDLSSPHWFEETASAILTPNLIWHTGGINYFDFVITCWNEAHGIKDNESKYSFKYNPSPLEGECKYGAEMLQTLSLSKEQERLRKWCQGYSPGKGMISGPGSALRKRDTLEAFAERSIALKISEDYATLATDAWLLSVLDEGLALNELEWVLGRAHGKERELAVRLTEDVLKRRFHFPLCRCTSNGRMYSGWHEGSPEALRYVNAILSEQGQQALPPEQYERMGAYPGEFYSAWSNLDYDHALKVLRENLASEEKTRQLAGRGSHILGRLALDWGEHELAWQLALALDDGPVPINSSDIHELQKLSEWTARAPFIHSNLLDPGTAITDSRITRDVCLKFLFRLARNETEHAEILLDVLSHLNLSAEQHHALLQLLRVVRGEPNSHAWIGFKGDSPYLCFFKEYYLLVPTRRGAILRYDNPRLDEILERTLSPYKDSWTTRWFNERSSYIAFSALLASHGLVEAAYSLLEVVNLQFVEDLARALDDQAKISWFEEIARIRALLRVEAD